MNNEYREAALRYVAAYRNALGEAQIEALLCQLADDDLAILEELLILAEESLGE